MPTKHRRIAVTCDPELEDALRQERRARPGASDAALVRELALRAASLSEQDVKRARFEAFMRKHGVRRATRDIADVEPEPYTGGETASEALEWVRGDRLPEDR